VADRAGRFRSLRTRNYRLYVSGQVVSMAGTFMQAVAQAWLVLKLTNSGTALGAVATLQYLPILLLSPFAGVLVDRIDRRRLYMCTQALAGLEALTLGVLTATGLVQLWMVFVLAAMLGLITSIDQPVKNSFVCDLVPPDDLTNAISLSSAMTNTSRMVGPALAGITIELVGIAPCFIINACSFGAVILALALMRPAELQPQAIQPRKKGQLREALATVRRIPEVLAILLMAAVFFAIAWEWDIVIPLIARFTFHGGAGLYGLLMSMISIGAVLGALGTATRTDPNRRVVAAAGIGLGIAFLGAALAPSVWIEILVLPVVGALATTFAATINARLQLHTPHEMRGRVTALWMVATIGVRPIGAPLVGFVGQHVGPRYALGFAAIALLGVALPIWYVIDSRGARRRVAKEAAGADATSGDPALPLAVESS
jgi:MFS family permease